MFLILSALLGLAHAANPTVPDESQYYKFRVQDVRTLLESARTPTIDELIGRSFVCTRYTVGEKNPSVDVKTRHYYSTSPGILNSVTDQSDDVGVWTLTEDGWHMPSNDFGVTEIASIFMTPEGNLVSEWAYDSSVYSRGILGRVLDAVTFKNSSAVSHYYEFCRPAKL